MYAIEESVQKINGEVVETFQREICDGNTNLEIEAGTTGYKGPGSPSPAAAMTD